MLRELLGGLIELLWPKRCLACKDILKDKPAIDGLVCLECWGRIKKNPPPFYRCCGRQKLYFDRAFSPCAYEGPLKDLIHEFKYRDKDKLGATLSRLMIEFAREYNLSLSGIDAIIPVPLHPGRLREREFNQALILSENLAREFQKPVLNEVLTRRRATLTQTGLKDEQRFANVAGSFAVVKDGAVKDKNLLLVDDVLTTGATCSEAARCLKESGAKSVVVLTLAN